MPANSATVRAKCYRLKKFEDDGDHYRSHIARQNKEQRHCTALTETNTQIKKTMPGSIINGEQGNDRIQRLHVRLSMM